MVQEYVCSNTDCGKRRTNDKSRNNGDVQWVDTGLNMFTIRLVVVHDCASIPKTIRRICKYLTCTGVLLLDFSGLYQDNKLPGCHSNKSKERNKRKDRCYTG